MKKSKMKKLTFMGRIRSAWWALRGKPTSSIFIGVEVKHCDACEYRKRCKEMEEKEEQNRAAV